MEPLVEQGLGRANCSKSTSRNPLGLVGQALILMESYPHGIPHLIEPQGFPCGIQSSCLPNLMKLK